MIKILKIANPVGDPRETSMESTWTKYEGDWSRIQPSNLQRASLAKSADFGSFYKETLYKTVQRFTKSDNFALWRLERWVLPRWASYLVPAEGRITDWLRKTSCVTLKVDPGQGKWLFSEEV